MENCIYDGWILNIYLQKKYQDKKSYNPNSYTFECKNKSCTLNTISAAYAPQKRAAPNFIVAKRAILLNE